MAAVLRAEGVLLPEKSATTLRVAYFSFLLASVILSYHWGRVISRSFQSAVTNFDHVTVEVAPLLTGSPIPRTTRPRKKSNRVVSFVLYGNDPLFVKGAMRNAQMIPLLMPDWMARFYIDGTVSDDSVAEIHRLGGETVRVSEEMASWNEVRRIWRYLVLDEPGLEYVIFRDIDSRVSIREILAIRAWLASGIPFHAMHDHPHHSTALLGGMWGAYVPAFQNLTRASDSIRHFIRIGMDQTKMGDQTWLAAFIFPLVKDNLLLHDAFLCNTYGVKSHPFPAPREDTGEFVGNIVHQNFGVGDPYYASGVKRFNGTEAPLKCRLSPEYAFG